MNTEERIIEAAKRLFYNNGFHNTTARALAKECGIVHSNLFYYFDSLQDIAFKIMQEYVETSRKVVFELGKDLNPIELQIAYTILGVNYIHYDHNFANLCFEIPEIFSDAIYENASKEIFPELSDETKANSEKKIYEYLDMQASIKAEIDTLELVKQKKLPLNYYQVTEYILLLKKRIWDIDDATYQKSKKRAEDILKKVDYSKLNIFIK